MSRSIAAIECDVLVVGAGAAGLMCAAEAARGGKQVRVVDHASRIGEKIRISGGGRCNFTNIHTGPEHFISQNPRFCVSALSRYTPQDFIEKLTSHGIRYHEKTLGQLFCDHSATQIIEMLVTECQTYGAHIHLQTSIRSVEKTPEGYRIDTDGALYHCTNLVVATGGLSIPKIGATGFGYGLARQFDMAVVPTAPALVPLLLSEQHMQHMRSLAGVSTMCRSSCQSQSFEEACLITHRGMSGPAILQISSYWNEGQSIILDMSPKQSVYDWLKSQQKLHPRQHPASLLPILLPKRLATYLLDRMDGVDKPVAELSDVTLRKYAAAVHHMHIIPVGTEGYAKAEVTKGGVDTRYLSSKTMESTKVKGLYFIGEVVDVTGHLGGFNFQWAWASAMAAGRALAESRT